MIGTREADNPVKSLSSRKADKEGHIADVVADGLFRLVLAMRFRRRGEPKTTGVHRLLSQLVQCRREMSLVSCILTADRGYGKPEFVDVFLFFGLSFMLIASALHLKSNPFVAASALKSGRDIDDDDDDDQDADARNETSPTGPKEPIDPDIGPVRLDRPHQFIVPNGCRQGFCVFHADFNHADVTGKFTANAIRETGTSKHAKVVRFSHLVPVEMGRIMNCWVLTPKAQESRLIEGSKNSDESHSSYHYGEVMKKLRERAVLLTLGQRCQNWFVLRNFRITATLSLDLFSVIPTQICSTDTAESSNILDRAEVEWMGRWMTIWFSRKRSSEEMMRGTKNDNAVLRTVASMGFVYRLQSVGLVRHKEHHSLACSPDGVCFLELYDEFRDRGWNPVGEEYTDSEVIAGRYVNATVEVKTNVVQSSLAEKILLRENPEEPIIASLGFRYTKCSTRAG